MPNFMHQGAHECFGLDDFVTLRRAHPEHDRWWCSAARIVGIEEAVQFAAGVARADAADVYAYGRSAEQPAYFGGERASASCGDCEVAGFERAHQRIHRVARRGARYNVEALDFVTFEVGTLRARREPVEKCRQSRLGICTKSQAGRHRTSSIRRILTSGASSTFVSSALQG